MRVQSLDQDFHIVGECIGSKGKILSMAGRQQAAHSEIADEILVCD